MRTILAVVVLALAACAHESNRPDKVTGVTVERQLVAGHDDPTMPALETTQTELIHGLDTLSPKPDDRWQVADIHDVLDDGRIKTLEVALAQTQHAKQTADEVTVLLRNAGILEPNERIVGIGGRMLYKLAE